MVEIVPVEEARARKRWWDGAYMGLKGNYVYDYFGRDRAGALADLPPDRSARCPHAFFVEQEPDTVLPAHFHMVDQFQVLLGGGGTIGRHPMEGFGVHYTNAYTTYGPIQAGPAGFHYFTLRNAFDGSGAHRMPESAKEMRREPRRHVTLTPPLPASAAELAGLRAPVTDALHPVEADGLGIWRFRLPPSAPLSGPDPSPGAGQYWIVLAGELLCRGRRLAAGSCLFVTEDDDALEAGASDAGADVIAMQFPQRA